MNKDNLKLQEIALEANRKRLNLKKYEEDSLVRLDEINEEIRRIDSELSELRLKLYYNK